MARPDVGVMRELLARVEVAEGPDRDLDREIHMVLGFAMGKVLHGGTDTMPLWNAYTGSIDAAVALVERTLPGAVWHVMTDYGDLNRAKIGPMGRPNASVYRVEDRTDFSFGDGDTPPLAICAALLTALIAAEDQADPSPPPARGREDADG
ncbi:hypothetical protein [Methylobacterium sp. J-092]|uniref:hypothetical protein n=1 Tax=Methylobacterium sp. J-092 TaxID=2836667 RepID=UPI001FBA838F|nr:hypothetical protein [Methylobacterium sp. J-092]MCJ2007204.1 hypothetical protein [Methylobacterium sp. J-092]